MLISSTSLVRLHNLTYLYRKIRPKNSFLVFLRGMVVNINCKERNEHSSLPEGLFYPISATLNQSAPLPGLEGLARLGIYGLGRNFTL